MDDHQGSLQLASDLRTVVTRLVKKLRAKSPVAGALSLTERSVIKLLDQHDELQPGELAAMEKITNQAMSQILNHLLSLGLISRRISAEDKRKIMISLSETGKEKLLQTRHERDEWLSKAITEKLTQSEKQALSELLEPLSRLVDFD